MTGRLADILNRLRERRKDSNVPLYAYRIDGAVVNELTRTLRERLAMSDRLNDVECAAYCLIASRVFCRDHREGPWSWEIIHAALGEGHPNLQSTVYPRVKRGLGWWGRPFLFDGRGVLYLATLVCEGGLPLHVLRSQGSRLRRFLKNLLRDKERFPHVSWEELSLRHESDLPETLRNDCVFGLAGKLVESVIALRTRFPDPTGLSVSHLDKRYREWRDQIPLDLADAVAVDVLNVLLEQPRHERVRPTRFGVDTVLELEPRPRMFLEPRIPMEMSAAEFADRFGVEQAEVPLRFTICLEDRESHRLFTLTGGKRASGGRPVVGFDYYPKKILIEKTPKLIWTFQGRERQTGYAHVEGGVPDGDLPWTFVIEDDRLVLRGEGRAATRKESAYVVMPDSCSLRVVSGEAERVSEETVLGRSVHLVRGAVEVRSESAVFRIETGKDKDELSRFSLQGRRLDPLLVGEEIWRGMPAVVELDPSGERRVLLAGDIECRVGAHGAWGRDGKYAAGRCVLRVRRGDDVVFQRRVTVLPKDFELRLSPGTNIGSGTIRIWSNRLRAASTASDGPPVPAVRTNDEFEIHVGTAKDPECGHVLPLNLMFDATTVTIRVPFPGHDVLFVNREGKFLKSGSRVSVQELSMVHARAFSANTADRFVLLARPGPTNPIAELDALESGLHDLPLDRVADQVEELLVTRTEKDVPIQLSVEPASGTLSIGIPRLDVFRHDVAFDVGLDDAAGRLHVRLEVDKSVSLSPGDIEAMIVEGLPIFAPRRQPISFDRVGDGWELSSSNMEPGAWIVRGRLGSATVGRPTFVPVRMTERTKGTSRLVDAIHADKASIRDEVGRAIETLLAESADPDWKLICDFLLTVTEMPLNTFVVNEELVRRPPALAYAVLMTATRPEFGDVWRGLEKARFLWCLVPVRAWSEAARMWIGTLRDCGLANDEILGLLEMALKGMAEVSHMGKVLAGYLTHTEGAKIGLESREFGSLLRDTSRQLFWKQIVDDESDDVQALLRAHSRGNWPRLNLASLRAGVGDVPGIVAWPSRVAGGVSHRADVMDAPVLAAAVCASGHQPSARQVAALREARFFDRNWFETVQQVALSVILGAVREREEKT